jgi:hypothetical protein
MTGPIERDKFVDLGLLFTHRVAYPSIPCGVVWIHFEIGRDSSASEHSAFGNFQISETSVELPGHYGIDLEQCRASQSGLEEGSSDPNLDDLLKPTPGPSRVRT